jgi:hypothetical protein
MYLRTAPGATCFLRREQDDDPSRYLKYFSDEEGLISIHVRPLAESKDKDIAKFTIDCELDGSITRYPLHLQANHSESSEMPFPSKQRPLRKKRASIRPGLTKSEALRLSRKELLKRGYPPRPNSKSAPLDTWLKAVSIPVVIVKPQPIINMGVKHPRPDLKKPTANWSGFVLSGIDFFDTVYGQWNVPWVPFGEPGAAQFSPTFTASSIWVGIDGYSSGDLIQTGTAQQSMSYAGILGSPGYTFFNYYAWTEVLPNQQSEVVQSNLPVSPGDQMWAASMLDYQSGTGTLFLQNSTTNEAIFVPAPVGAFALGWSAEWIMERPQYPDGSFTDLSNYLFAIMSGAFAVTGPPLPTGYISYNGTIMDVPGGSVPSPQSIQVTMVNGSDVLSQVTPLDSYSMFFNWVNFR